MDMSEDALNIAQLSVNGKRIELVAFGSEQKPEEVRGSSVEWQRWAIEAIKRVLSQSKFKGKDAIACLPAGDIFVQTLKAGRKKESSLEEAVMGKLKNKLPFRLEDSMFYCIETEQDNAIAVATERAKIDRYLAIFQHSGLKVKSIGIWPDAVTSIYSSFFGRRKSDLNRIVMLVDINAFCTRVVISRYKSPLFAQLIKVRVGEGKCAEESEGLFRELDKCRQQFEGLYKQAKIESVIFLSPSGLEREFCISVAKKLELPAQMGDCLAVIDGFDYKRFAFDRRMSNLNWAGAFGLSLS